MWKCCKLLQIVFSAKNPDESELDEALNNVVSEGNMQFVRNLYVYIVVV